MFMIAGRYSEISRKLQDRVTKTLQKAEVLSHEQVFYKLTQSGLASREITNQPPLIYHPFDMKESMGGN